MNQRILSLFGVFLIGSLISATQLEGQQIIDIAELTPDDGTVSWIFGSQGNGSLGLPVAAGGDVDGDGHADLAVAFFRASPSGRDGAGEVDLVLGDGTLSGFVDTAEEHPRMLRFLGDVDLEAAGSEIWIDDVTGDGLADLLICRQNFTPDAGRIGAGALTIVSGGAHLRQRATLGPAIDLRTPDIPHTTLVGELALDRLGIWVRTGDLDGDGIHDLILGADQEDLGAEQNRGAVWIFRGGPHLADAGTVDLGAMGTSAFGGQTAKITPPSGSGFHHFGATCLIADLDDNGRGEALIAATLNRGGAILPAAGAPFGSAQGVGGTLDGDLFIAWDDNFPPAPWPVGGIEFSIPTAPGSTTRLRGSAQNVSFGEELLGGMDLDGDDRADLFVGDLAGDGSAAQDRPTSGLGWILFDAATLKGADLHLDDWPTELRRTKILGGETGALGADTAAEGDFNGDGQADLAFTSPHANPVGRASAGAIDIGFGGAVWPATVDLASPPPPAFFRMTRIYGARGTVSGDQGDTLGYSAASGDLDGDGRTDLVTNEMVGNGLGPDTIDVGNLIALSGRLMASACFRDSQTACLLNGRFEVTGAMQTFANPPVVAPVRVMEFDGRAESDLAVFFESFNPGNFEAGVKMVDGCGPTVPASRRGHWLFIGGLTNADTTIEVQDTARPGDVFVWNNPAGELAQSIALVPAFACEELQPPDCVPGAMNGCLEGRFRVTGQMLDFGSPPTAFATNVMEFDGRSESDQAVFFESFADGNFEVGVKMVDACGLPEGHPHRGFWTFYGGLTNAATEIQIVDTVRGYVDTWTVTPGQLPRSEARTPAFSCID